MIAHREPPADAAPRRRRSVLAVIVMTLLVGCAIVTSAAYFPERFSDVRAFYCAGHAVLAHADPYREHPLNDCERSVQAPLVSPLRYDVTVPAPFPGYVLLLFAALALLPFGAALGVWFTASLAALAAAIVLLARVTRTPRAAVAIACGFPAAAVALPLGQITPFVLLAVVGAAAYLAAGRPRAAAAAALAALVEPHVGLAVVIGIGLAVPRARLVLATGIAGLAILAAIVGGPLQELEYLRTVLPAHALANMTDASQFSATNFAYAAGAPASVALALGTVWYVAALAVGALVARRLTGRLGSAAPALVPPAFAVFGGTHTHLAQLALAIPAFLLVHSVLRGRQRGACAAVTFVAAVPWLFIAPFPLLFPVTAMLAYAFARLMAIDGQGLRLAAGSLVALASIFVAIVRSHVDRAVAGVHVAGNPLAEVSWQVAMLARNATPEYWYAFAKAPTVLAFLALFAVLVGAALRRRPHAA